MKLRLSSDKVEPWGMLPTDTDIDCPVCETKLVYQGADITMGLLWCPGCQQGYKCDDNGEG